jgi:hypothetical protein
MDEEKEKQHQLTQQEVSKHARVMGVFSHDAQTFPLFFIPKKKKKRKRKFR